MKFPSELTLSHFVILGLLLSFASAHCGLAALRPRAEKQIDPRAYRLLFATVSLPWAVVTIIYFFQSWLRRLAVVASLRSSRSQTFSMAAVGNFFDIFIPSYIQLN